MADLLMMCYICRMAQALAEKIEHAETDKLEYVISSSHSKQLTRKPKSPLPKQQETMTFVQITRSSNGRESK